MGEVVGQQKSKSYSFICERVGPSPFGRTSGFGIAVRGPSPPELAVDAAGFDFLNEVLNLATDQRLNEKRPCDKTPSKNPAAKRTVFEDDLAETDGRPAQQQEVSAVVVANTLPMSYGLSTRTRFRPISRGIYL